MTTVAAGDGGVRLAVDPWDPGYGSALSEAALEESTASLTLDFETPPQQWSPMSATADGWRPSQVLIVDGVRRIDARVWFTPTSVAGGAAPVMGIAASYAAGVVKVEGAGQVARVVNVRQARGIYTSCAQARDVATLLATYQVRHTAGADPEKLIVAIQGHMRDLELDAALAARDRNDDLLIVDGPIRGRTSAQRTIGYVKTHHTSYLGPELNTVVSALAPGQRTPVFSIGTTWSRHSWYLKLPVLGAANVSPWAGIVRCEAADVLPRTDVLALADSSVAVLPPLASQAHKDPRAPQNLVPIGGLEAQLRHRLGDPVKLHRSLVAASRQT